MTRLGYAVVTLALLLMAGIAYGGYWIAHRGGEPAPQPTADNFSKDGTVVENNPGFKADTWYLVYEEPGAPGLTAELIFDRIAKPALAQGQRVHVEGVAKGAAVSVSSITIATSTATSSEAGMPVKLYYYNPALDQGPGGAQCTRSGLVAVERVIPTSTTPLSDTIKLLLRGQLSGEERAAGITTEFPLEGVTLASASIKNGAATLAFDDPQNKTSGGSCRAGVLWFQIEATAKQFSGIKTVRFSPDTLFQP